MKKIVYVCDGCGAIIDGDSVVFGFGTRDIDSGMVCSDEDKNNALDLDKKDFCSECARKLEDYIKALGKGSMGNETKVPITPGEMKIDKSAQPDWIDEVTDMIKRGMNDRQILSELSDKDPEEVKLEIQNCRKKIENQLVKKILEGNRRASKSTKSKEMR